MFPEKQKRGFRVHRNKENEILDALQKGRALPGLFASQTPKGVQILGGAASASFSPQWKVSTRLDPEDGETIQCSVNDGWLIMPTTSGRNTLGRPSTLEDTTWPGTATVWEDLPAQTGMNYVKLDVTWTPYRNNGGFTLTDGDTVFVNGYSWSFAPTLENILVTSSSNVGFQSPGEVSEGPMTEYILIATIDAGEDPPEIVQYFEGCQTITSPVVFNENSSGDGPLIWSYSQAAV